MATITRDEVYPRLEPLRSAQGFLSWVHTTDHKRIGILYMVFSGVFFFIGGMEALAIRIQLDLRCPLRLGGSLQPADDHARRHHDLFCGHACPHRLCQLLCSLDDRVPRHGLPAVERHECVAVPVQRDSHVYGCLEGTLPDVGWLAMRPLRASIRPIRPPRPSGPLGWSWPVPGP